IHVVIDLQRGGAAGNPMLFVGESRTGVLIHGSNWLSGGGHVILRNLTFDLSGFLSGSFSTLTVNGVPDVLVDHVTFTGDCMTGYVGGHIETSNAVGLTVDSCIIEKFGHCATNGSRDHGIYLDSGSAITIRNNVIRGNSARGIQLYTAD